MLSPVADLSPSETIPLVLRQVWFNQRAVASTLSVEPQFKPGENVLDKFLIASIDIKCFLTALYLIVSDKNIVGLESQVSSLHTFRMNEYILIVLV